MKAAIFTNYTRDRDGFFTERVKSYLTTHAVEVTVSGGTVQELERADADFVIALGGDGTILRIAPFAAERDIPIMGINIGGVGALSTFGRDEIAYGLQRFVNMEFAVDRRMMLELNGESALNDIVIYRGHSGRPIKLNIRYSAPHTASNELLVSYLYGDGLIVATPTGSTAYSLNAGGKIVDASSEQILITPIVSRAPFNIVSADTEVSVTLIGEVPASVSVDGREPVDIPFNAPITIRKSDKYTKLVKFMNLTPSKSRR
ncbi:MAG: NAD(+)/NADH kinase [Oscillospiraceae bacterium]|jgi:NAD+ kinase|nr:NAD(+)/NADH kinase [Oscillospiraceae bacterium]